MITDPYQLIQQELQEELVGIWDAAEDCGETRLTEALGEAEEKGEGELGRKIFEGTIDYVLDLLLLDIESSVVEQVVKYRREHLFREMPWKVQKRHANESFTSEQIKAGPTSIMNHSERQEFLKNSELAKILGWKEED